MEFRNHQVWVQQRMRTMRSNPLAAVLVLLLLPVLLAIGLFVILFTAALFVIAMASRTLLSLFSSSGGRAPRSPLRREADPSAPPPDGGGPTIDVDVVRKDS
jgi:hypothetical protein